MTEEKQFPERESIQLIQEKILWQRCDIVNG